MNTILVSKFYAKYKAYLCQGGMANLISGGMAPPPRGQQARRLRHARVRGALCGGPPPRAAVAGREGAAREGSIAWLTISGGSYLPSGPGPKAVARPRITPRRPDCPQNRPFPCPMITKKEHSHPLGFECSLWNSVLYVGGGLLGGIARRQKAYWPTPLALRSSRMRRSEARWPQM